MTLYRAEICIEILLESEIGKSVKYLEDFCKANEKDLPECKSLSVMAEQILTKWKNFVMHTIFDDNKNNASLFYKSKILNKLNRKKRLHSE